MARLIIDREGMAAEFLHQLAKEGRTVVTILKSNQYAGLASFTDVGTFVPLCRDRDGAVTREVACARVICQIKNDVCQITCHAAKRLQRMVSATYNGSYASSLMLNRSSTVENVSICFVSNECVFGLT